MVSNGKWCPLGCGKSVMSVGFSVAAKWRCIRCNSEFSISDLEGAYESRILD